MKHNSQLLGCAFFFFSPVDNLFRKLNASRSVFGSELFVYSPIYNDLPIRDCDIFRGPE